MAKEIVKEIGTVLAAEARAAGKEYQSLWRGLSQHIKEHGLLGFVTKFDELLDVLGKDEPVASDLSKTQPIKPVK